MAAAKEIVLSAPTVFDFMLEHGRVPLLGKDPVAPWHYKGWMLQQIQLAHYHPQVCNRWGWYMRTLEAGKLLDEPIPRIIFADGISDRTESFKVLRKALDVIFNDTGSWSAFPALIDWLAWACGVANEEPRLSEQTNEKLYRTFDFGPLLLEPYDALGTLYAEGKGRWNPSAFYPTPHNIVEMMTRMMLEGEPDCRTRSVCDPCVGTGRMLLHASNYSLRLYGVDIDRICVLATKINGVLYAPWLTFPIPDDILGVKSEAPPVIEIAAGPETPIYTVGKPTRRRKRHEGQGLLFEL